MRIIKVLLVLGVCIAVLGFYRGWFSLSSDGRDAASNKVNVSLTVDADKVKEDAGKAKDRTTALTGQVTED